LRRQSEGIGAARVQAATRLDGADDRLFWSAFVSCAISAMVPLWTVKYLPMVDLPQHAAQISICAHLHDPQYGFADYFELHYFTPYLAVYGLATIFAKWTSVLVALKLVISLCVLALPASLVIFFKQTAVSRWWALLGFSLAYGYSFGWGFLNFMLGVPVTFVYLAVIIGYARAPDLVRGAGVAMFTLALFTVHALLLLFCPMIAALIIVADVRDHRSFFAHVSPLLIPLPIGIVWSLLDRHQVHQPLTWGLGADRIYALFELSECDKTLVVVAAILASAAIVALRRREDDTRLAWLPYAATVAVVLLCPVMLFGAAKIAPRFNVFLLPFLIMWLRPVCPRLMRGAIVVSVVAWMALLTVRFASFDRDARDYDVVEASIAPRSRLRPIIFLPTEDDFPFLHFPVWTQARKGGIAGFSFASNFAVARYRSGAPRFMVTGQEWQAPQFDWRREAPQRYDYYVVRSESSGAALTRRLFEGAGDSVTLIAEEGKWHVYDARSHASSLRD
jgi:hypothetical protein